MTMDATGKKTLNSPPPKKDPIITCDPLLLELPLGNTLSFISPPLCAHSTSQFIYNIRQPTTFGPFLIREAIILAVYSSPLIP